MTSVVIAAHNEDAVLDSCLDAVLGQAVQVIVVANGCTDDTAAIARRRGAEVIEHSQASKPAALNAGDAAATLFPRLYIDADVVLGPHAVTDLVTALAAPGALVAVPRRDLELAGRPWPVRAYYAIHSRLPAVHNGLYGRGVIALSEAGRARFTRFPSMMADDLFVDSLFRDDEKLFVATARVRVAAPMRTLDLVYRLARIRAGNAAMRATGGHVRRADRLSWLRDVVARSPGLAPAAFCYVVLTVAAAVLAGHRRERSWGRDESSRQLGEHSPATDDELSRPAFRRSRPQPRDPRDPR